MTETAHLLHDLTDQLAVMTPATTLLKEVRTANAAFTEWLAAETTLDAEAETTLSPFLLQATRDTTQTIIELRRDLLQILVDPLQYAWHETAMLRYRKLLQSTMDDHQRRVRDEMTDMEKIPMGILANELLTAPELALHYQQLNDFVESVSNETFDLKAREAEAWLHMGSLIQHLVQSWELPMELWQFLSHPVTQGYLLETLVEEWEKRLNLPAQGSIKTRAMAIGHRRALIGAMEGIRWNDSDDEEDVDAPSAPGWFATLLTGMGSTRLVRIVVDTAQKVVEALRITVTGDVPVASTLPETLRSQIQAYNLGNMVVQQAKSTYRTWFKRGYVRAAILLGMISVGR